jgi:eukaryotic-like serine/threonine-protein kinase
MTTMADDTSRRFGRYRVERKLGEGGMGTVYQAHDELLGRQVAIKTVSVRGLTPELFHQRFLQEARAVAVLSHHPNIVSVHDLGFDGETPYLVMELVRGTSLKERIAKAPLAPPDVRRLGVQLARALEAAHAAGILHRDVKPANVLEAGPELWKLADFGVAHVPDSSLTWTGQFVGSPAYAAPESYVLGEFSAAADIYGLGATLYEATSGRRPYADEKPPTSLAAIANRPAPSPIDMIARDVPRELADAIMGALERDPGCRPTASELADILAGGRAAPRVPMTVPAAAPSPTMDARVPWALEATVALPGPQRSGETSSISQFATSSAAMTPARGRGRLRWFAAIGSSALLAIVVAMAAASGAREQATVLGQSVEAVPLAAGNEPLRDREEPAAAVNEVASALPPAGDEAPVAAVAPAPAAVIPAEEIPGLQRYRDLVAAGRGSSAVTPLVRLRKQFPRSAEIPYLLGQVYFDRLWCSQGIEAFRAAIAKNGAYRQDEHLITSALHCFLSPPNSGRVSRFLRDDVGTPAVPYLQTMATKHPNSKVRERAARALRDLQRGR